MNQISRSVMTMVVIFAAAFLLAAMGCSNGNSSGNVSAPPPPPTVPGSANGNDEVGVDTGEVLQPLKPEQVRECTVNEFSRLVTWKQKLDLANELILVRGENSNQWVKNPNTVSAASAAGIECRQAYQYHKDQPCKKTKKTIVSTDVKVYDAYRIKQQCSVVQAYLKKFNIDLQTPAPQQPVTQQPVPQPQQPEQPTLPPQQPQEQPQLPVSPVPDVDNAGVDRQCDREEFSQLSSWSADLDKAQKLLANLGSRSQWKYDAQVVAASGVAAKSCESRARYHEKNPCIKTIKQDSGATTNRIYSKSTIDQRCESVRSYYYDYVQRTDSLIAQNADLYLDLSSFKQQKFDADSVMQTANCVVENRTAQVIDYSNQKARVKDTRGFQDKMMVLETTEGLLFQCYSLDIGAGFSKTEVVRVVRKDGTMINLNYILK